MGYEGGDLLLAGAALAGGQAAERSLWMQDVGGGLSGLAVQFSDECALKASIHTLKAYIKGTKHIDAFTFFSQTRTTMK